MAKRNPVFKVRANVYRRSKRGKLIRKRFTKSVRAASMDATEEKLSDRMPEFSGTFRTHGNYPKGRHRSAMKRNPRGRAFLHVQKTLHRPLYTLYVRWNKNDPWMKALEHHNKGTVVATGVKFHKRSGCAAKVVKS